MPAILHFREIVDFPAMPALDRFILDILQILDDLFTDLVILIIILLLDEFGMHVLYSMFQA